MQRGTHDNDHDDHHEEHDGEHVDTEHDAVVVEPEHPEALRRRVLRAPCAFCGQGRGHWCVDAGGREIRNIYRQHDRRYQKAATTPAELRVLLAEQRLI